MLRVLGGSKNWILSRNRGFVCCLDVAELTTPSLESIELVMMQILT